MAAVRGFIHGQAGDKGIILCARQFMNSLDDSSLEVKRAIEDEPWLRSTTELGDKVHPQQGWADQLRFCWPGSEYLVSQVKGESSCAGLMRQSPSLMTPRTS